MDDDAPRIPQFQDLVVADGAAELDRLIGKIEERIRPPWSRDLQTEGSRQLSSHAYRIFKRDQSDAGPELRLFLMSSGSDVEVANVVPSGDRTELTKDEYNDALGDFTAAFLKDAAESLGLVVILSPTELDLRDVLDATTYQALVEFSRASNRSTGSSHPLDRERWYRFLVSVYRTRPELSPHDLESWLVLDGWSEDVAWDLLIQFEFAMGLLDYVDRS